SLLFGDEGVQIDWKGGQAVTQFIECREDLMDPENEWRAISTNVPPTAVSNLYFHAGVTNDRLYYRVRTMK
ncbi:MAG: hypothetical protein JXB04_07780, partial [Kiritimatiellae bacterium]|nr:hypothetical protein [Kiritimatiellia bacterium]